MSTWHYRIIQYPELEESLIQPLAPQRTTQKSNSMFERVVQMLLEFWQLGAMSTALLSLPCPSSFGEEPFPNLPHDIPWHISMLKFESMPCPCAVWLQQYTFIFHWSNQIPDAFGEDGADIKLCSKGLQSTAPLMLCSNEIRERQFRLGKMALCKET